MADIIRRLCASRNSAHQVIKISLQRSPLTVLPKKKVDVRAFPPPDPMEAANARGAIRTTKLGTCGPKMDGEVTMD